VRGLGRYLANPLSARISRRASRSPGDSQFPAMPATFIGSPSTAPSTVHSNVPAGSPAGRAQLPRRGRRHWPVQLNVFISAADSISARGVSRRPPACTAISSSNPAGRVSRKVNQDAATSAV